MMKLIAFSSPALLRKDESINGCTICSMRFLTDPNRAMMNAAFCGRMRMIMLHVHLKLEAVHGGYPAAGRT